MKYTLLKIGKYKIAPCTNISIFEKCDFNIVNADSPILVSKQPLKWFSEYFYVTLFGKQGNIKNIL